MNPQRESLTEVADSGFGDNGFTGEIRGTRGGPICYLLNAILNAERAACAGEFDTPPATETECSITALA